jgi:hypothetical protein
VVQIKLKFFEKDGRTEIKDIESIELTRDSSGRIDKIKLLSGMEWPGDSVDVFITYI